MNPLLRQLLVVSSMLLTGISTGSIMALPGILIKQLRKHDSPIKVDLETETWIASVHGLAGIPSILVPHLMQCWGRRFGFRTSCFAMLAGWIILYLAKSSLAIIIAELFQGAGGKSLLLAKMVTIGEMVHPKLRKQSFILYGLTQSFSVLTIHTAGNFIHWKTVSLINIIPLALALIFSFIWPESPAWLAYKGRFEESRKSFIWLRGKNKESLAEMTALFSAQREFLQAISTKLTQRDALMRSIWMKVSSRDFYLPIFHMFVLLSCYYWSGNLLIIVYAINFIGKVVQSGESAFIGMIIIDVAFIIGNITCLILLQHFGNKNILVIGGGLSVVFLLGTSTVFYLQEIGVVAADSTLCLYFLVGFMLCSSTTFYMIPFVIAIEIIPLRHRGVSGSFYIIIMSSSYATSLKIAPYLIIYLKTYGIFLLYSIITSFCLAWVWKYVPETKNRTLQSIEEHFVKYSKAPSNIVIDEEANENIQLNSTSYKQ